LIVKEFDSPQTPERIAALDLAAYLSFIRGVDIPETIEQARAALVERALRAEAQLAQVEAERDDAQAEFEKWMNASKEYGRQADEADKRAKAAEASLAQVQQALREIIELDAARRFASPIAERYVGIARAALAAVPGTTKFEDQER
jgi:hypothetical protein